MGDTTKELPRFFTTSDVRKILKIGNKACEEIFLVKELESLLRFLKKILKNISKQEEYLKKKIIGDKNEDLNIRHLNLQ